jgi:hypothetical protein
MFNSFYQPIKTMKIGAEVDWGRKNTLTGIEAEALATTFGTPHD